MTYGFLIPVYNHGKSCYEEVKILLKHNFPIILVDDDSNEESKEYLNKAKDLSELVDLVTLNKNLGKGGAVINGIKRAHELNLDYVLQIDADGQHDINRVEHFIELSKQNPGYAIIGYPVYDDTVPASRMNGRKVANNYVHFTTWNKNSVVDSMCGFRVYPIEETYKLVSHGHWDYRMGFDIEILVRMYWHRIRMISESVKVTYPEGAASNFHLVKDNARISFVFAKLTIEMFFHIPSLLKMRKN